MRPDFIVRQIVTAPDHFGTQLFGQRLKDWRGVRPAEGRDEFCQPIGPVECGEDGADVGIAKRMDKQNHRCAFVIVSR